MNEKRMLSLVLVILAFIAIISVLLNWMDSPKNSLLSAKMLKLNTFLSQFSNDCYGKF